MGPKVERSVVAEGMPGVLVVTGVDSHNAAKAAAARSTGVEEEEKWNRSHCEGSLTPVMIPVQWKVWAGAEGLAACPRTTVAKKPWELPASSPSLLERRVLLVQRCAPR